LTFCGGCGFTEIVAEAEPLRATEAGDTLHVEFGGAPVQLRVTVPEKPFAAFRAAEYTAVCPDGMVCDDGVTVRLKSVTEKLCETVVAAA
jgi:hypothetical protein